MLFEATLQHIRETSQTTTEQGTRFERLVRDAFITTPEYGDLQFRKVWLWNEWPERHQRGYGPDIGVDLVAEDIHGELIAVQCKFYQADHQVPTAGVDSFIAASEWSHRRILVATAPISRNATPKIRDANPRCEVITREQLAAWNINWWELSGEEGEPPIVELETPEAELEGRYTPHPYQTEAVNNIVNGLRTGGTAGQLILPCGTGKSVVALWAAEQLARAGGRVLYLVPSLALMGQTMREWASQRSIPHQYLGVCSDPTVARARKTGGDDEYGTEDALEQLAFEVSTNPVALTEGLEQWAKTPERMGVVFATYQSLDVVRQAQQAGADPFDLIICDEAHRTAGFETNTASSWRMVHDNTQISGDRRLYMTATPRVFTDLQKKKIAKGHTVADSYSMDDETVYGPKLYHMSFADAIEGGWLSDYEILVLAVSDRWFSVEQPDLVGADGKPFELTQEEWLKTIGIVDAFADPTCENLPGRLTGTVNPAETIPTGIAYVNGVRKSKRLATALPAVAKVVANRLDTGDQLTVQSDHMDGSTPANVRRQQLEQLKTHRTEQTTSVICNDSVLTEGVDVPALGAVVFYDPRRSTVDVTQAVGRAMRRAADKTVGRIILPVEVTENEDGTLIVGSGYDLIYSVINALRSHDERVDYWVNSPNAAKNKLSIREVTPEPAQPGYIQPGFPGLVDQIAAKLVDRCGDRKMWPTWGQKTGRVYKALLTRTQQAVTSNTRVREAFDLFHKQMKATFGEERITEEQAISLIVQDTVLMPALDEFFPDSGFVNNNPLRQQIQHPQDVMAEEGYDFAEELKPLEVNYKRMSHVFTETDPADKSDVFRKVCEGFISYALKEEMAQLGIAYTPQPVVEFTLRSVDAVFRKFGNIGLTDEQVHIVDPFVGTGTFPKALLTAKGADGEYLIRDIDLIRKYQSEIHAIEIVWLAFYMAGLNIEHALEQRGKSSEYYPFENLLLGDSLAFASDELKLFNGMHNPNRDVGAELSQTPWRAVITNPPWTAGNKDAKDRNPNLQYPTLRDRVKDTYGTSAKQLGATGGKAFGNMYVYSFRAMTDALAKSASQHEGFAGGQVLAYVHPNSLTHGPSLVGVRARLREEFSHIYVVDLKGDAYQAGDAWHRQGDNVFSGGTRCGVQITICVKLPGHHADTPGKVFYAAVKDYASLEEKFSWLDNTTVLDLGLEEIPINPDLPPVRQHDWTNVSDGSFYRMPALVAPGNTGGESAVSVSGLGVTTGCDGYVYAFGRTVLISKIKQFLDAYESARQRVLGGESARTVLADRSLDRFLKWSSPLKRALKRTEKIEFDETRIRKVLYRPFVTKWLYADDRILSSCRTVLKLFPEHDSTPSTDSAPPPGNFWSQNHPSGANRVRSPADGSQISTSTGLRHGTSQQGNNRVQSHWNEVSGVDHDTVAGSGFDSGVQTDTGYSPEAGLAPPPAGGGWSQPRTVERSLRSSQPDGSQTYAQEERTNQTGSSPTGYNRDRTVEHGELRDDSDRMVTGPASDRTRTNNQGTAPADIGAPPPGMGLGGTTQPTAPVRSPRHEKATRPVRHRTTGTVPPPQGLLTQRDGQLPFGTLTTYWLTDLHVLGRPTRLSPHKVG